MQAEQILNISRLRHAVGLLGEKEQHDWWPSGWFGTHAATFLEPLYGPRHVSACFQGVVEAARRVHDERIGVGRVFHLFRLPESLERRIHEVVILGEGWQHLAAWSDTDTAREFLASLAADDKAAPAGPVRVGKPEDLNGRKWLGTLASYYQAAFAAEQQTFPYFTERL